MPLNFLNYKIRAYFRSDQTGLIITLGCERISIDEKQTKWTSQGALIRFFFFFFYTRESIRSKYPTRRFKPPNFSSWRRMNEIPCSIPQTRTRHRSSNCNSPPQCLCSYLPFSSLSQNCPPTVRPSVLQRYSPMDLPHFGLHPIRQPKPSSPSLLPNARPTPNQTQPLHLLCRRPRLRPNPTPPLRPKHQCLHN